MEFTFHKYVSNDMTSPNPTQYTKLDEYKTKTKNLGWPEIGYYGGVLNCSCYWSLRGEYMMYFIAY